MEVVMKSLRVEKISSSSLRGRQSSISFPLLVTLRWVALVGQITTLSIIDFYFHMVYPRGITWAVVGLSIVVNAILMVTQHAVPKHKIPTAHIYWYLIYDIGQLTALLYLTGGLNNPFSVFLLGPVVIAAGFLRRRDSLIVTICGILATLILYTSVFPLPWESMGLVLPEKLRFAVLVATAIAMVFISIYVGRMTNSYLKTTQALQATELALAREQKLASLGALAAAAAHELGSPLTTMLLVIKEMQTIDGLDNSIKEDVQVLSDQTNRCREILQGLSRDFSKDHVLPFKELPLRAALEVIIASCNQNPEKTIGVDCDHGAPIIELTPELQHALGNVISNAIQFAKANVKIICTWTQNDLKLVIADDGKGYSDIIVNRLGEPYISTRTDTSEEVHLGLGLFIAQSLIEKKGGVMYFYNHNGAVCEIILPREG